MGCYDGDIDVFRRSCRNLGDKRAVGWINDAVQDRRVLDM